MITLVNPNLVVQRNDIFTTGIVYMPIGLAYFASALKHKGYHCNVIDAFGENPNQFRSDEKFFYRGLTAGEIVDRICIATKVIVLYAINITHHRSLIEIIRAIRSRFSQISLIVMENSQAVTAYSLRRVQDVFYDAGVDYVITGEAEERGVELIRILHCGISRNDILKIDGIGSRMNGVTHYIPPERNIARLDTLPFPAWDLFPLQNYWKLKYAHGPYETKKYLPIVTSRGCPFSCKFCIIPETNDRNWRARSAKNVVDEIEENIRTYGVHEYHIEDVNPTVNNERVHEICNEILCRNVEIIWKISSGTKVETLRDESTIAVMAKAGCRYISISPETGSPRLLKLMNKPFNLGLAIRLVKKMNAVGIRSQSCFVLGYPGENNDDRRLTWKMVHDLTKAGVDEIALFIVSPMPGAEIFDQFAPYADYSRLNFSPTWRGDYNELNRFRIRLYRNFLFWKLWYHPLKIAKQPINFMLRRFETKMEMIPYRALHTLGMKFGLTGKRCRGSGSIFERANNG
ncbi:MAG: B12-binding domain-containing radical SAM protein [Candidatus Brocadiaceae bacterium]|nr:B12-binding domain-containing radical SAM protein [Candidatus Brocadiaceae bacterium]